MDLIDFQLILLVALIFVPLERILALHHRQKVLRRHWANDLVYLFFNSILIRIGQVLVIGGVMAGVRLAVPDAVTAAVRAQPIWLQAPEVIVIADVGFYLAHRAFHAVPALWRFHASSSQH